MHVLLTIPVYFRTKKVKDCIDSLLYTNIKDYKVSLYIGINGADESLRHYLYDKSDEFKFKGINYLVEDPLINLGKPKIVNDMVYRYIERNPSPALDYLISIDSDMISIDKSWLVRMVSAYESFKFQSQTPKDLGALCANQKLNNCHVLDIDPIIYSFSGYKIITRVGNEGVAGGVLMTSYSAWKKVGGYKAHRIYASDDGHYALACSENDMIMGVHSDVSFIHPAEDDEGYIKWKQKALKDNLKGSEEIGYW